jgi:hypothetical protein
MQEQINAGDNGKNMQAQRGIEKKAALATPACGRLRIFTRNGMQVYSEDERSVIFERASGPKNEKSFGWSIELPQDEKAAYICGEGNFVFVVSEASPDGAARHANESEVWALMKMPASAQEPEKVWRRRTFEIGEAIREFPNIERHTSASPPHQWFPR